VEETAGRRDAHVDAGAEGVLLGGHADAAVHGVPADPRPLRQASEGDLDLGRELAGRREDEGAGSPRRLLQQSLQDRQQERGRLAGPGLRGTDDVATGEDRGDRLFLDRGGSLVAEGVDRPEEDRFEAELVEGMLRVGCMHRPSYELIGLRVPIRRTRILRCAFPGLVDDDIVLTGVRLDRGLPAGTVCHQGLVALPPQKRVTRAPVTAAASSNASREIPGTPQTRNLTSRHSDVTLLASASRYG